MFVHIKYTGEAQGRYAPPSSFPRSLLPSLSDVCECNKEKVHLILSEADLILSESDLKLIEEKAGLIEDECEEAFRIQV